MNKQEEITYFIDTIKLTNKSAKRLRSMKTLAVSTEVIPGQRPGRAFRQIKRWFQKNPNRRVVGVRINKLSFGLVNRADFIK